MIYRVIGAVADIEELTLSFTEFQENAGTWSYELKISAAFRFPEEWKKRLEAAANLSAAAYQFLHVDFGHYMGGLVKKFIDENNLHYQVALVSMSGFTALYQPGKMISQLGSGAAVAAQTQLPVVSDLPVLDVDLGGNGKFMETIAAKITSANNPSPVNKAVCVALMGIFRWREEYNFLSSVTGAGRSSIGGAVWLGQEA